MKLLIFQFVNNEFLNMKVFMIFCACLAFGSSKRLFHNDQVLRVHPTEGQRDLLKKLPKTFPAIDFWTGPRGSGPVDIHVPWAFVGPVKVFLNRHRINNEVFIDDVQKNIDNERSFRPEQMDLASFNYNVYHTLDEIQQWIDDITASSSIATKMSVGFSFEGRQFHAIKLSKGGFNKPAFVINCGLHSREWVSPSTCLYTVKYFVEATTGSDEASILNNMDVYVIPISNPDGYVYTWTDDRMWRKTKSDNQEVCIGVDPNRNWDANWGGPGASDMPCDDSYYGPSMMSEIEVQSQAEFVGNIPNVKAYIDIHAYGQLWMFPYAYTYAYAPDYATLNVIAGHSASVIQSVHGMRYKSGPISDVIYQASGSTADYFYDKQGITCSFAAELRDTGRFGFILPEAFIQPTAEETFAGLKVIANYVTIGECD